MSKRKLEQPELLDLLFTIRACLTPDLLLPMYVKEWKSTFPREWRQCYVATEAAFFLMKKYYPNAKLAPAHIKVGEVTHWFMFVIRPGSQEAYIDLTACQFTSVELPIDYLAATRCGFLTKFPCARTQELMDRVEKVLKGKRK